MVLEVLAPSMVPMVQALTTMELQALMKLLVLGNSGSVEWLLATIDDGDEVLAGTSGHNGSIDFFIMVMEAMALVVALQ